jgi:predicted negative regulator of RcsB-dependent stress response
MARRRFRRKDLKQPDEFVSRGRQVVAWAQANVQRLAWIGGSVLVVLLAGLGFFNRHAASDRQASDDLARALVDYRAERYAEAANQLRDVASRWQSTPAGRVADLYAANADLNANNFDGASTVLEGVLNGRQWPSYLQQQAVVGLAFALERRADFPGAAARYAEAAALEGPYTPAAILGEARCREQAGDKDKARQLYERYAHEFPDAPESELIAAKLGQLSG